MKFFLFFHQTAFYLAVSKEIIKIVQLLLSNKSIDVNAKYMYKI